jgi:DNA invertase Pin-like site-specific DNA recombinase
MLASLATSKMRPDHLARQALISIRQSTMMQVRTHTGSTIRQYDLVARARDLGWPQAHMRGIDQAQGASGATAQGRDGFQDLVADVGRQRAGAVFCLEASRLARSCSDWYSLLEICALTDTLVIDDEGIDDPGQSNDRFRRGFLGTMREAERHWLRQRVLGGNLAKAPQGQLRMRLPVGLVYDPTGQVVREPDDAVREAVRLVFALFTPHGSALAVVPHCTTHRLRCPTRLWGGSREGELGWNRLSHARV